MTRETLYALLADAVLILHFAYVAFVVVGLLVVWIGHFCRWSFVRNFYFRSAHLLSMAIVVAESVFGITCPQTVWEADLRELAGQKPHAESFMQHWIHRLMFLNLEPATFIIIYAAFFAALVLSYVLVRPRSPWKAKNGKSPFSEDSR